MQSDVTISLRAVVERDIPFLESLRRTTMRQVIENHYPWSDAAQRERVLSHLEYARIISCEGSDIGLLKVVSSDTEIHLSQVQILPAYQGRGIGRRLIRKILEEAASSKLPITLHVLRSNRAISLYRALGFVVSKEDEHFLFMQWTPKQEDLKQ
ncbi:MAG TPA: GNAT family N-acetyltransferase [Lacipirellulaceae bacterium]|nr:GNAT family N-acetyltransferase [Lacipirellulaceae bacterium]